MSTLFTILNIGLFVGTFVLLIRVGIGLDKSREHSTRTKKFLRETQEEINQFWKDIAKGRGLPPPGDD